MSIGFATTGNPAARKTEPTSKSRWQRGELRLLPSGFDELVARHYRHQKIEDDQARMPLFEHLECFGAVGRKDGGTTCLDG